MMQLTLQRRVLITIFIQNGTERERERETEVHGLRTLRHTLVAAKKTKLHNKE